MTLNKEHDSYTSALKFNFDKGGYASGKYIERVDSNKEKHSNHLHLPMISKSINENSNI